MAGLAQSFLSMAVSAGAARLAGLPAAAALETHFCANCQADTEHAVANTSINATFVIISTCLDCGAISSYAPPPVP